MLAFREALVLQSLSLDRDPLAASDSLPLIIQNKMQQPLEIEPTKKDAGESPASFFG